MDQLRVKVEGMIGELLKKIDAIPEKGRFPMVYSEFKVTDGEMCLTDVLLSVKATPDFLPDSETHRWLELSGYKLPVPYKATRIIIKGTNNEIKSYLQRPEAVEKIRTAIPELDFNLSDV